jgi:hypothetical protein
MCGSTFAKEPAGNIGFVMLSSQRDINQQVLR